MAKHTAHEASFKGKVVIVALRETKPLVELFQDFKLYPSLILKLSKGAVSLLLRDGLPVLLQKVLIMGKTHKRN